MIVPNGKALTDFTIRVYLAVRDHGPLKAAGITKVVYPEYTGHQPNAVVGGALGKLKRSGVVGWTPRTNQWFVLPGQASSQLDQILAERGLASVR